MASGRSDIGLDVSLLEAVGIQRTKKRSTASKRRLEEKETYADKFAGQPGQGDDIKYFFPDLNLFIPMGKVKKGDWLAEHKEKGQTFKQFLTGSYCGPNSRRQIIYLLPVVLKEDPIPAEVMKPLIKYASIFFGMTVKQLKKWNALGKVTDRMNDGVYQAHAGEILHKMKTEKPRDAFCLAGITMTDLYPKEAWNFVFGLAMPTSNCGVYSLARYLSNFGTGAYSQIDLASDPLSTILVRACKTMCHEIGHVFGLRHCIHFKCLMNGSNHLDESDARPNFLCPVCLRKLHHVCKFDIVRRYHDMRDFWTEHDLPVQTEWLNKRLVQLSM